MAKTIDNPSLNKSQKRNLQTSFSIRDMDPVPRVFLVTLEKGKYLIPFRTQKSSPSSPMVLYTRVWESRSLPGFSFALQAAKFVGLFYFPIRPVARAIVCPASRFLCVGRYSGRHRPDFFYAIARSFSRNPNEEVTNLLPSVAFSLRRKVLRPSSA